MEALFQKRAAKNAQNHRTPKKRAKNHSAQNAQKGKAQFIFILLLQWVLLPKVVDTVVDIEYCGGRFIKLVVYYKFGKIW